MRVKLNDATYLELVARMRKIERIDPCSPIYKKLIAYLDALPDSHIVALAHDDIKWITALAKNRAVKRGLYKSKLSA